MNLHMNIGAFYSFQHIRNNRDLSFKKLKHSVYLKNISKTVIETKDI